jgi:hypothetical protein
VDRDRGKGIKWEGNYRKKCVLFRKTMGIEEENGKCVYDEKG